MGESHHLVREWKISPLSLLNSCGWTKRKKWHTNLTKKMTNLWFQCHSYMLSMSMFICFNLSLKLNHILKDLHILLSSPRFHVSDAMFQISMFVPSLFIVVIFGFIYIYIFFFLLFIFILAYLSGLYSTFAIYLPLLLGFFLS